MTDIFDRYKAAWHRAEAEGAVVDYTGLTGDPDGYFHPHERPGHPARPRISIKRPYYDGDGVTPTRGRNASAPPSMRPPDLAIELVTLAHEYGHLMSWKARTPRETWEAYDAVAKKRDDALDVAEDDLVDDLEPSARSEHLRSAVWAALTDEERARVLAEEQLAWDIAAELLSQLGFDDWPLFGKQRSIGLHVHRHLLGLGRA